LSDSKRTSEAFLAFLLDSNNRYRTIWYFLLTRAWKISLKYLCHGYRKNKEISMEDYIK
jgi:hypothetical protein